MKVNVLKIGYEKYLPKLSDSVQLPVLIFAN
jgi:hypothetical protein